MKVKKYTMRRLAGRRKRPPLHGPSAAPHRLPPRRRPWPLLRAPAEPAHLYKAQVRPSTADALHLLFFPLSPGLTVDAVRSDESP
ncbi:hypothetical protein VTN96DRAFT_5583 [Rasamsonia emersonii]